MKTSTCRWCGQPVILLGFDSGERVWHHAGPLGDEAGAYFYCSSRHLHERKELERFQNLGLEIDR